MKDELFKKPLPESQSFQFNNQVAEVFDDMLSRSIPFYDEMIRMCSELAAQYYQPQTKIYDLGCSTGRVLWEILNHLDPTIPCVGVDASESILEKAKKRWQYLPAPSIEWRCEAMEDTSLQAASVVFMNYTLQFIPVESRQAMLQKVYDGLKPGGVLVFCEKVTPPHALQNHYQQFHDALRQRNGYSLEEIQNKRKSLEGVLITESVDVHETRLKQVGFHTTDVALKWYQFMMWIAIK